MLKLCASELKNWKGRLVDVRTPHEFGGQRLPNAENIPLDRLTSEASTWDRSEPLILMCDAGVRSQDAANRLEQLGFSRVHSLEGGLQACKRAGLEVIIDRKVIPIVRQVMLAAGAMVLLGLLLAKLVSPWFLVVDGVVGCGMVLAGATGICPMAGILQRMPWNAPAAGPMKAWAEG